MNVGKTRKNLLEILKTDQTYSRFCIVDSVDREKFLCNVTAVDNLDIQIQNVYLSTGPNSGHVLIPRIGSRVIVNFLTENTGYVSMISEVDVFHHATKDDSSLKLMLDLIKIIKTATWLTHQGPTIENGMINVLEIEELEERLKKFYLK